MINDLKIFCNSEKQEPQPQFHPWFTVGFSLGLIFSLALLAWAVIILPLVLLLK